MFLLLITVDDDGSFRKITCRCCSSVSRRKTPLHHVTRNFYFASKKDFVFLLLVKCKEYENYNENHMRDGAGCQRHSHSSLFMFIYRSPNMFHMSFDDRKKFNRTWFVFLSPAGSLIAFFSLFVVTDATFALLKHYLTTFSIISCAPLEWT